MLKKTFLKKVSLVCVVAILTSSSVFLPDKIISPLLSTVEAAVNTTVLDDCDSITGWTSDKVLSLDSDSKEGTSSIKYVDPNGSGSVDIQFEKVFSAPVNTGVTKENGYLQFWYYVSDPNKLTGPGGNRIEISSSGTCEDFYGWTLTPASLKAGWNFINLKISDAVLYSETPPAVDPNLNAINYFRLIADVTGSITTKIDDIHFAAEGRIFDNCDSTTGWTSDMSLSTDPNDKKEGTASLKYVDPNGNGVVQFEKILSTPVNTGVTKENGYLQFWYYVSDPNQLSPGNRVEISSSGTCEDFYGWNLVTTSLGAGWNFISLKISDATVYGEYSLGFTPNLAAINYFRLFFDDATGSVTTKIDDIRFTEPVIDSCDSTTGWSVENGTLSLDMTDEREGSGSLKCTDGVTVPIFSKQFSTPVNSGITDPNTGYLQLWYYISDPNKLTGIDHQVEITSSGQCDVDEYGWYFSSNNLSAGWNFFSLKISDAQKIGNPNLSAINFFRIYNYVSSSVTMKIDDIRFTRDNILKLDVAYYDNNNHFVSRKFKDDVADGYSYTFQSGDYVEYDIRLLSDMPGGGVDCSFTAKYNVFDPNKVDVPNDIITITSHGYNTGDPVKLINTSSTGSLPGGLNDSTDYYIKVVDPNSFKLYDSSTHASAGDKTFVSSAVNTAADTITINSNGCKTGDMVRFMNNDPNNLPGGLSPDTDPNVMYYYVNVSQSDPNVLKIYIDGQLAIEGGAPGLVDLTSGGSGTHTMRVGLIDITGGGTGFHLIWMDSSLAAYTWVDQKGYSGALNTNLRDPNCDADAQWYTRRLTIPTQAIGGKTKYWTIGITDSDPNDKYKSVTLGINNVRVYRSNGKPAFTAYVDGQPNDASIVRGGLIGSWSSESRGNWEGNCSSRLSVYDITDGLPSARPNPSTPTLSPAIITPSSPYNNTKDKIVADYNLSSYLTTDEKSNRVDVTDKIQDAMAYCFYNGGGTVYLPAGYYGIHDTLMIPPGVTLRGDWRDPDVGSGAYGTVLCIYSSDSPVLMMFDTTLNGITFYYPHQTLPPSYQPYTIDMYRLWGDCSTVQNCTLLNSYNGINGAPRCVIDNVKGTCLKTGFNIYYSMDINHVQRMTLKNDYWSDVHDNDRNLCWGTSPNDPNLCWGTPAVSAIDSWTLANGTGIKSSGRVDMLIVNDVSVTKYKIGWHATGTNEGGTWSRAYQFNATRCNKALLLDNYAAPGMQFTNCTLKSSGGIEPVAVEITGYDLTDDIGTILFNTCTIGADDPNSRPVNAVRINGNNGISNFMANLQNCTFNNWSGDACINAAGKGTVVVEGCDFGTARTIGSGSYGVKLSGTIESAVILGNTFTGNSAYLVNDTTSPACDLQVHNPSPDTTYRFEKLTNSLGGDANIPWNTADHKPNDPNNNFYNVVTTYNAQRLLPSSTAEPNDSTSAIQQALNAAGSAGGGVVYLPGGRYKVSGNLTVPANVELRGSFGGIHEYMAYGTVLSVYGSPSASVAAADTDQAFITLAGNNAGVRGLSIFHPNLDSMDITAQNPEAYWDPNYYTPYPFDIRGGDPNHQDPNGLYVIGVTHINSFKGIDFSKYRCDNHLIKYDYGTCLHDTYKIGKSNRGWVENVENLGIFSMGYALPENLYFPARAKEQAYQARGIDPWYAFGNFLYMSKFKDAVTLIGDAANEYMISRWELNKARDITVLPDQSDPNKAPHAVLNGFTSGDGTTGYSYYIKGTAPNGIISINDTGFMGPALSPSGTNTMFVHLEGGVFKQFNADLWQVATNEAVNSGFEITGGTYVLQGGMIINDHIIEIDGSTAKVKINGIWIDESDVAAGTENIRVLNCSQDPNTPSEFFGNIGNANFLFYKDPNIGNISGGGNATGGRNILRSDP